MKTLQIITFHPETSFQCSLWYWTSCQPQPKVVAQIIIDKFKCISKAFRWQSWVWESEWEISHEQTVSWHFNIFTSGPGQSQEVQRRVLKCKMWRDRGMVGNIVGTFPNLQKHIWWEPSSPNLGYLTCLIAISHPYWKCQKFLTWQ